MNFNFKCSGAAAARFKYNQILFNSDSWVDSVILHFVLPSQKQTLTIQVILHKQDL